LLAHSAIDVDWTYPALVAMTAALLGAAVSSRLTRTDGVRRRHSLAAGVLLAGVTLLSIAGVARWMQVDRLVRSSAAAGPDTDAVVRRLLAADSRYLPDGRLSARALTLAVPDEFTGGSTVSADVASTLLRHSQRTAANDAVQQMQRAQLLAASGDPAAGLRLAQRILAHEGSARPFLQGEYAELLAATGRRDEALDLLAVALADPQLTVERPPAQLVALTATLARLAGTDPPARVVCALWDAHARVTSVVPATPSNGDRPQACP
jgi:hypothetical protein